MRITRRTFLASLLASGAVGAVIAPGAPRLVLSLSGPTFTRAFAAEADTDWLGECVLHSVWHIDGEGFGGRPVVRHPLTGLAYVVSPAAGPQVALRQIAPAHCRCREDLDPDYIVGHAARHVAEVALARATDWRAVHAGPVYLRFAYWTAQWPEIPPPEFEDAPPLALTPLAA